MGGWVCSEEEVDECTKVAVGGGQRLMEISEEGKGGIDLYLDMFRC